MATFRGSLSNACLYCSAAPSSGAGGAGGAAAATTANTSRHASRCSIIIAVLFVQPIGAAGFSTLMREHYDWFVTFFPFFVFAEAFENTEQYYQHRKEDHKYEEATHI
jgi:hypothetical protein